MKKSKTQPIWPPEIQASKKDIPPDQPINLDVLVAGTHCQFGFTMFKRKLIPSNDDPTAKSSGAKSEHDSSAKAGVTATTAEIEKLEDGDDVKQKLINSEHIITLESEM